MLDWLLHINHRVFLEGQSVVLFAGRDRQDKQVKGVKCEFEPPACPALFDKQTERAAGALACRKSDQTAHTAAAGEGQVWQALPHLLFVPAGTNSFLVIAHTFWTILFVFF